MAPLILKEDPTRSPSPTPSHTERRLVQILGGILILAILYTLYFAKLLLLPIAIALLLSALLRPMVDLLQRIRIPEGVSAALIVCLLIGIVGFSAYRLSIPAAEWFERKLYGPGAGGEVERDFCHHRAGDHPVPGDHHPHQRGVGPDHGPVHGAAGDAEPRLVGCGGRVSELRTLCRGFSLREVIR